MEPNILEILVLLMKQYPEGVINREDFEPLTRNLMGLGYTEHEIEMALFWFYNNRRKEREGDSPIDTFCSKSYRVLHDFEKTILSPEAYGYLLELRHLELLSLAEMHDIIEKVILLGERRIRLEDMKMFVASYIFVQEPQYLVPGEGYIVKTPFDKVH